jgi:hypothetical protein
VATGLEVDGGEGWDVTRTLTRFVITIPQNNSVKNSENFATRRTLAEERNENIAGHFEKKGIKKEGRINPL